MQAFVWGVMEWRGVWCVGGFFWGVVGLGGWCSCVCVCVGGAKGLGRWVRPRQSPSTHTHVHCVERHV